MKKRFSEGFFISFLLVLSLFFTSCSHINGNGEDLISTPEPNEIMTKVINAVREYCGENAKLVYPYGGKNINPISFYDINGDGVDEIIVLYRNSDVSSKNSEFVNITVFSDNEGALEPFVTIEGAWYDIGKFEVSDLDGDGICELIVGYQNLDIDSRLSVYSFDFEEKTYTRLRDDTYTDWVLTDINNDGFEDVVLIYINNIQGTAMAIAYKPGCCEDENPLDYVALGKGGDFYKMTVATDSTGNNYILVSSKHGTLLSSTEILSWNPVNYTFENVSYSLGRIENTFHVIGLEPEFENPSEDETVDSDIWGSLEVLQSPVENLFYNFCSFGRYVPSDVDGDGLTEFPMCYEFDETSLQYTMTIGKEKLKYRYNWFQFETASDSVTSADVYRSIYNDYVFIVNENWNFNRVYAIESNSNYCNFFYMSDVNDEDMTGKPEKEVLLFSIVSSRNKMQTTENLFYLSYFRGMYYYLAINPEITESHSNILPPVEELKNAFVCDFTSKLINTFDSYISDYHNYIFIINDSWKFDKVSVFESYNRDFVFYYIVDQNYLFTENDKMKIPMFSIKSSEVPVSDSKTIVSLASANNTYYYIEINPGLSEEVLSVIPPAEELKEAFVMAMITAAE